MYFIRKVGDRQKGMGLRITKFHAITHMSQDILHFGVPLCFDTHLRITFAPYAQIVTHGTNRWVSTHVTTKYVAHHALWCKRARIPTKNLLKDFKFVLIASHYGVNVAGFIGNVRSGGNHHLKTFASSSPSL
jgi:hypothetical protein